MHVVPINNDSHKYTAKAIYFVPVSIKNRQELAKGTIYYVPKSSFPSESHVVHFLANSRVQTITSWTTRDSTPFSWSFSDDADDDAIEKPPGTDLEESLGSAVQKLQTRIGTFETQLKVLTDISLQKTLYHNKNSVPHVNLVQKPVFLSKLPPKDLPVPMNDCYGILFPSLAGLFQSINLRNQIEEFETLVKLLIGYVRLER